MYRRLCPYGGICRSPRGGWVGGAVSKRTCGLTFVVKGVLNTATLHVRNMCTTQVDVAGARSHICCYGHTVPYEGDNFANSKMDNFSLIID